MKIEKTTLALIAVFLLLCFSIYTTANNRNTAGLPESVPRRVGFPNITKTYSELEQYSIDQIVDDNDYIYVLYGEHEGNVQVFNHSGEYQYSAFFATHLNGAFSIAAKDGCLYVCDEYRNLYILKNGELQSFYQSESAKEILKIIDFNVSSAKYKVRFGSIWRVEGNDAVCIVERSPIAVLYQGNLLFYASLFVAVAVGVLCFRYKHTREV